MDAAIFQGRLACRERAAVDSLCFGTYTRMSLILPKGIVVNSAGVNGDIERINQEPLDLADIAKLWKGTSTKSLVRMELTDL